LLLTGFADGWRANSSPRGFIGGGHAGYNWQSGAFVYGLEADVEGADIKGTGNYRFLGGAPILDHVDSKTDFQGSFRGRLGWAANNWLFYATGGLAWADIKHTYVTGIAGPPANSFSTTRAGYTVGAGVEYGFTPNWSGRLEYRYSDYGTLTNNVGAQFVGGLQDQKITDNSVRVGLSYRWGGAVVAKY
jgi:outer membrane immunogenic protein